MESIRKSKGGTLTLIAGLMLLIAAVVAASFAIMELKTTVHDRRSSFEIQDTLDDLNLRIKDWVVLSAQSESAVNKQGVRLTIETDIENLFTSLNAKVSKSKEEHELSLRAHRIWNESVKNSAARFSDQTVSMLRQIDLLLVELDQTEHIKVENNEVAITHYANRLIFYIGTSVFISIILILYSLKAKRDEDIYHITLIEELTKLREEALSASKLKSKFLATVSHEIRTPLNGIIGLSDILLNSTPSNNQKIFFKTIHQSGKSLLGIINDILDFSKIELGKFDLEKSDFSIVEVLDQILLTLSAKADEKGISLFYEVDLDLPQKVNGDSARLSQVLFNLLGNAIKFTSKGSVILRVKIDQIKDDTSSIIFSIEDTGIGMSEDELKNLFIPFAQGKKTGTSGEAGTGLGLSISQHIVDAMGGKIQATSELGKGSKFWFKVSFANCSLERVGTAPRFRMSNKVDIEKKMEPIFIESNRPKILVVEDNPTNQIVAQSMLSKLGANSIVAADGAEAVNLALKSHFDLILMDCQMPIMDGFEATRALRKEKFVNPIVAMTANASKEDEENCFNAGMDDFLAKPISLSSLEIILKKHLIDSKVLSSKVLENLEEKIGKEVVLKVVKSFIFTIPDLQKELNQLIGVSDISGLNRLGHKYKSSSLTVGAEKLGKLCMQLEEVDNIHQATVLVEEILFASIEVENTLQKYVSNAS